MPRFIVLMHNDTIIDEDSDSWGAYLDRLRSSGRFDGGSSIGDGAAHRLDGRPAAASKSLVGYLLIQAGSLANAQAVLAGNPVYEAGGTVEIRELVED
jgi:hypothetical protein